MWPRCLNEPVVGAEIIDLSILPDDLAEDLADFFDFDLTINNNENCAEYLFTRRLTLCILLVENLFPEVLCFTFIAEYKTNHAFVSSERMEPASIRIVLEALVQFMLPNYTSGSIQVDQFETTCSADIVSSEC